MESERIISIIDHEGFEKAQDDGFTVWDIIENDCFVMKLIESIVV